MPGYMVEFHYIHMNTVSYCEYTNTKNIGNVELNPADIDLMGLVIIRIGERLGGVYRFLKESEVPGGDGANGTYGRTLDRVWRTQADGED